MKYSSLFIILFFALLAYALPAEVWAQGIVPCDGTTENPCNSCQLVVLGENILRWLIGVMLVIFAILVAISGFNLVTSAGNPTAKTDAKKKLTNAFIGIIIVLAAWLIVDTLMRSLLIGGEGQINSRPWSTLECINANETTMPVSANLSEWRTSHEDLIARGCSLVDNNPARGYTCPGGCVVRSANSEPICENGAVMPELPPPVCAGGECVALSVPCTNGCTLSPSLAPKINSFHAAVEAAGVSGTRVTEAMPPSQTHQSTCHVQGTCIDYSKQGGMTPQEVIQVVGAAKANGLRPVYEVNTVEEYGVLKAAFRDAGIPTTNLLYIQEITAPHFSIYAD